MAEQATFRDAQTALATRAEVILDQIPVEDVQLSLPVDGRGVRIKASVPRGQSRRVPASIGIFLEGRELEIPIETTEDYEPMAAL